MDNNTLEVTLTDATVSGLQFLDAPEQASISGTLHSDTNGNGAIDTATDGTRSGVLLFIDLNLNGSRDAGEPTATTNASGAYTFSPTGTPPAYLGANGSSIIGTPSVYRVRTEDSGAPFELLVSPDVTITDGSSAGSKTAQNVLTRLTNLSIAYRVIDDKAGDGAATGDATISGASPSVTLYRDANNNGTLETATDTPIAYSLSQTTGPAAGTYSNLRSGTYFLVEANASPFVSTGVVVGSGTGWTVTKPTTTNNDLLKIVLTTGSAPDTGTAFLDTFGYTVTGTLYSDLNGNGQQDVGESGIGGTGFSVALNKVSGSGTAPAAVTPSASGAFTFTNVYAGSWTLSFTAPTGWTNTTSPTQTYPVPVSITAGANVNPASSFSLFSRQANLQIAGTVFRDTNADGVLQSTETATITGAVISLYRDANGNGTLETTCSPAPCTADTLVTGAGTNPFTTKAAGTFSYTSLTPGTYFVSEADPSGYYSSGAVAGTFASPPTSASVLKVVLTTGNSSGNAFLDLQALAQITGTLYGDLDGSGTNTTGDVTRGTVSGLTLTRLTTTPPYATYPVQTTATTNASGVYTFANLPGGSYRVDVAAPTSGTAYEAKASGTITLANGQSATVSSGNNLFTRVTGLQTSGAVFEDKNDNNTFESAIDMPISAEVRIYLDSPSAGTIGTYDDGVDTLVTSTATYPNPVSGTTFSFGDLLSGKYIVAVNPTGTYASGGSFTNTTAATTAGVGQVNLSLTTTNVVGATSPAYGFLVFYATGQISGTVYSDPNGNGARDLGEPVIQGARVFSDRNNNGALDTNLGEKSVLTAADGTYTLTGLRNATHNIRLDPAQPRLWNLIGGPQIVTISAGEAYTGKDLYAQQANLTISGSVINDVNNNGVQDAGETVTDTSVATTVRLYRDANASGLLEVGSDTLVGTVNVATTQACARGVCTPTPGLFSFTGLTGATYFITEQVGSGWKSTGAVGATPVYQATTGLTVSPLGGSSILPFQTTDDPARKAFKYVLTDTSSTGNVFLDTQYFTLSGTMTLDVDGDGPTAGDPGLGNRTVYLDANGNGALDDGERTTTTSATGAYSFGNLLYGSYTVDYVTPGDGWVDFTPKENGDLTDPRSYTRSVGPSVSGLDFSTRPETLSIAYRVVDDTDADGLVGDGEGTMTAASPTVSLYRDANADNILQTTIGGDTRVAFSLTEPAGGAEGTFEKLGPGTYFLVETTPTGYVSSAELIGSVADLAGTLVTNGSVTRVAEDQFRIVLRTGSSTNNRFLDTITNASATVTVRDDVNGDGALDGGDGVVAGVAVTLVRTGAGGLRTGDANKVTVTSDANGVADFPSLVAGTYEVRSAATTGTGWILTKAEPGTLTLTAGSTWNATLDLFRQRAPHTVTGAIVDDKDANGVFDGTDSGAAFVGRTVELWRDLDASGTKTTGDRLLYTATTDASGAFTFTAVPSNPLVIVQVTQPTGFRSTPGSPDLEIAISPTGTEATTIADRYFFETLLRTVSGTVYSDTNGNGTLDASGTNADARKSGVTVFIDADGDGALTLDGDGNPTERSTTTDTNGAYAFANVIYAADPYRIRYVVPTGFENVGTLPIEVQILTTTGATVAGQNFLTRQTDLSISGAVVDDADADTVADPGESGIADVTLFLDDGDDILEPGEPTTTTLSDGTFVFEYLRPGSYRVVERDPSGYASTTTNVVTVTLTDTSATGLLYLDALAQGAISGTVWNDLDGNASSATVPAPSAGANEPLGRGGVTVSLFRDANRDGTLTGSETTAIATKVTCTVADAPCPVGSYSFGSLPVGRYVVRETVPGGFTDTVTGTTTGNPIDVTLPTSSSDSTGNDFFVRRGDLSIAGTVVNDVDANGIWTQSPPASAEPGLAGSVVSLYVDTDGDGALDLTKDALATRPTTNPVTTVSGGAFTFGNLVPGRYFLVEANPTGFISRSVDAFTIDLVDAVSTGNVFLDTEQRASISGTVWNDLDGNRSSTKAAATSIGTNEPLARGGVTVSLFEDANRDGVLADAETTPLQTTTSCAAAPCTIGAFSFGTLTAGWYVVQASGLAALNLVDTVTGTTTGNAVSVKLTSGATSGSQTGKDLFVQRTDLAISGAVVDDLDADTTQDAGEPGLQGVTVSLFKDDGDGNLERSGVDTCVTGCDTQITPDASTNAAGAYAFTGLRPGIYFVLETGPLGTYVSTGAEKTSTDSTIVNADRFRISLLDADVPGNVFLDAVGQGSISGTVWNDLDGNAASTGDDDEPLGRGGVTVSLYRDANRDGTLAGAETTAVATAVTCATPATCTVGTYAFGQLTVGRYVIRETVPTNFTDTVTGTTTGNELVVTLDSSGATVTARDFFVRRGNLVISGTVVNDLDADGTWDTVSPVESGLAGASVALYRDANGNGTYEAGTDPLTDRPATNPIPTVSGGVFSFGNLVPGTYFLVETNPTGFTSTGATKTSVDSTKTTDDVFTIDLIDADATSHVFLDTQAESTIAGTVFSDTNGNGALDTATDPKRNGVAIVFIDTNNDGFLNGSERSTTVSSTGTYSFDGLITGTYRLRVIAGTGWENVTAQPLNVSVGQGRVDVTGQNLLTRQTTLAISGKVYEDLNGNGTIDGGETTLTDTSTVVPSFSVFRDANANGVYDQATDLAPTWTSPALSIAYSAGSWTVSNLRPGTYFVVINLPDTTYVSTLATPLETGATTKKRLARTLSDADSAGEDLVSGLATNYFLVAPAAGSVTGVVFKDWNDDGIRQAADEPVLLDPVTVTVTLPDGTTRSATSSATDGSYTVTGLPRSPNLAVAVTEPTNWTKDATLTAGVTVNVPNTGTATLNLGYLRTGLSAAGAVLLDNNGDGITSTVTYRGGSVIRIYRDANRDGLFATATDTLVWTSAALSTSGTSEGRWTSPSTLRSGTYFVVETDPAGLVSTNACSIAAPCNTPASAPVADPASHYADASLSTTDRNNVLKLTLKDANSTGSTFLDAQVGSTLSGDLFADYNGNGTQDRTEPFLSGFKVSLTRTANTVPVAPGYAFNQTFAAQPTAGTDTTGAFSFAGLAGGSYTIGFDTYPAGTTSTSWAVTTPALLLQSMASGATSITNIEIGVRRADLVISGNVYDDKDANGAYLAGADGSAQGATVTLYVDSPTAGTIGVYDTGIDTPATRPIANPVTTDSTGSFSFGNLVPGDYLIVEQNPVGPTYTPLALSTGASGGGGRVTDEIVKANLTTTSVSNVVFLDTFSYSASGCVWADLNGNGATTGNATYVPGEPLLQSGVVVRLYADTDRNGSYLAGTDLQYGVSTTTSSSATDCVAGTFSVTGVKAGTYFLGYDVASGWTNTSGTIPRLITFSGNANPSNQQFFVQPGGLTISGTVFAETVGGATLSGSLVTLYRDEPNSLFSTAGGWDENDRNVGEMVVATGGAWSFGSLAPGRYFVIERDPTGYLSDPASTVAPPVLDANLLTIVLTNASSTGNTFVDRRGYTVTGTVWSDRDGSAGQSTGDVVRGGITVRLYRGDCTTRVGSSLGYQSSFENGSFLIEANASTYLVAGSYCLTYDLPSGWANTGTRPQLFTIAAGSTTITITGKDFYLQQQNLNISGSVHDDLAADTAYGSTTTDPGLAAVTVSLYRDTVTLGSLQTGVGGDWLEGTLTTGADGSFTRGSLTPGTYFAVETDPTDYVSTNSLVGSAAPTSPVAREGTALKALKVTLTDADVADLRFLDARASGTISGAAASDWNLPLGERNADDPALAGVAVTVTRTGSGTFAMTKTTTTGADGLYSLTGLVPGTYTITATAPAGNTWANTTVGYPLSATLATGTSSVTGRDLFFRQTDLQINGAVYDDRNADGVVQDATQLIGNAVVTLIRDNGDGSLGEVCLSSSTSTGPCDVQVGLSVTTPASGGSKGLWSFSSLTPGTYFVREVDPTNYTSTNAYPAATVGGVSVLKIRLTNANSLGTEVNVDGVTVYRNRFLDTLGNGLISGAVIHDANGNGKVDTRTPADPALPGAVITLERQNPRNLSEWVVIPAAGGAGTYTTIASNNAAWSYANLVYGVYRISQTAPSGFGPTGYAYGTCATCVAGAIGGSTTSTVTLTLGGGEQRTGVRFLDQPADFTISIANGVDEVVAGATTTYQVRVTNVGKATSPQGATVRVDLRDAVAALPTATLSWSMPFNASDFTNCANAAGLITCTTGRSLPVISTGSFLQLNVSLAVPANTRPFDANGAQISVTANASISFVADLNTDNDTYNSCSANGGFDEFGAPLVNGQNCNESARDAGPLSAGDPVRVRADVSVVDASPATVIAGNTLDYVVKVTNNGPSQAWDVKVTDLVPDNTAGWYTTATQCVWTGASQSNQCGNAAFAAIPAGGVFSLGNITKNDVRTIVIRVPVKSSTPTTASLVNRAELTSMEFPDTDGTNDIAAKAVDVTTSSALTAAITTQSFTSPGWVAPTSATTFTQGTDSGGSWAVAGLTMQYRVVVTNTGPSDDPGARLGLALPTTGGGAPSGYTNARYCVVTGATPCTTEGAFSAVAAGGIPVGALALPGATATATVLVRLDLNTNAQRAWTASATATTSSEAGAAGVTSLATTVRRWNDLSVEATAPATLVAGTETTDGSTPGSYVVTVTNAGPSDDTGAKVDILRASTLVGNQISAVKYCILASPTATDCSGSFTTLGASATQVALGALAKDASVRVLFRLAVRSSAPYDFDLRYRYLATKGGDLDPTATNDYAPRETGSPAVAQYLSTKVLTISDDTIAISTPNVSSAPVESGTEAGTSWVIAGKTLQYAVAIGNVGPSDDVDVRFTMTMPAGATYTAAAYCVLAAGATSCPGSPGSWSTLTDTNGDGVSDPITVTGVTASPTATRTVLVRFAVKSSVTKATVLSASTGITYSASTEDGKSVGDLTVDPVTSNNATPTFETTVRTRADLGLTLTGPADGKVVAGTALDYAVVIANAGPSDDTDPGAVLTFTPGDAARYDWVKYCIVPTDGTTCDPTTTLAGLGGALPAIPVAAGASRTVLIRALVKSTVPSTTTSGISIVDEVSVVAGTTQADPATADNTRSLTTGVLAYADLAISVDEANDPTTLVAGTNTTDGATPGTYTITVTNGGPSVEPDAKVDVLAASGAVSGAVQAITYCLVPASATACSGGFADLSGTRVALGSLEVGASARVLVRFTVRSSTLNDFELLHRFGATTSSDGDPTVRSSTFANDFAPTVGAAAAANYFAPLVKTLSDDRIVSITTPDNAVSPVESGTASGTSWVVAGKTLEYRIEVGNIGPSDDQQVGIRVDLPDPATFSAASACVAAIGADTCSVFTTLTYDATTGLSQELLLPAASGIAGLASGATRVVLVRIAVLSDVVRSTSLVATAEVSSSASTSDGAPVDPDASNDAKPRATNVRTRADLAIGVVQSPDIVQIGESLTYAITVTNNGPSWARDVAVTDELPARLAGSTIQAPAGADCSITNVTDQKTGEILSRLLTCDLHDMRNVGDGRSLALPGVVAIEVTGTVDPVDGYPSDGDSINDRPSNIASVLSHPTDSLRACDPGYAQPADPTGTYDPNTVNNCSRITVGIRIQRRDSYVIYDTTANIAQYSDKFEFKARLWGDPPNVDPAVKSLPFEQWAYPVAGAEVLFALTCNGTVIATGTGTTGSDGKVVTMSDQTITLAPTGACAVTAWWLGNATYFPTTLAVLEGASSTSPATSTLGATATGSGSLNVNIPPYAPTVPSQVTLEDAWALSNGLPFFALSSTSATSVSVTVKAALAEMENDPTPGDVSLAKVVFDIFASTNNGPTPNYTCPGTWNATTKVFECTRLLTEDNWKVIARIVETPSGANYYKAIEAADYVVTVYKPVTGAYTAGGGYILAPPQPSPRIAVSSTANRATFGFSVKYTKGTGSLPTGRVVYTIHGADGMNYVARVTSWTGGGLTFSSGTTGGVTWKQSSFGASCVVNRIDPKSGTTLQTWNDTQCRFWVTDYATGADRLAVSIVRVNKTTNTSIAFHDSGTFQAPLYVYGGGILVQPK
ncbi:MAG: SdrD B-like domain-containing protein [Actinomycetota bacterium]